MIIQKIRHILQNYLPNKIDITTVIQNLIDFDKPNILKINSNTINIRDKIYIISIGKVAIRFLNAIISKAKQKNINIQDCIMVTDKKYTFENHSNKILFSSHPYLSVESINNTVQILDLLKQIDSNKTTIIFLISGGASSMFEYPIIKPELCIEIYKYILHQNLNIYQINTIRRFFSRVKSGKLLQYIPNSQVISLIISDVPLNDLSTIGSGITFLKQFSNDEIYEISQILKPIIDHYNIHTTMRENFEIYNKIQEQNKNLDQVFHYIISDNTFAVLQVENLLQTNGINALPVCSHLNLKNQDLLNLIKSNILTNINKTGICYIFGGETSLQVDKEGYGGRLQHLSLQVLREIKNIPTNKEIIFFAIATDGIDGNTTNSGCIVSNKLDIKLDKIEKYLESYKSGVFFENPKNTNLTIKIPPGLTNINEIYGVGIF
ncbi:MAG: DUF4147 domain-containing protein [bacterium]